MYWKPVKISKYGCDMYVHILVIMTRGGQQHFVMILKYFKEEVRQTVISELQWSSINEALSSFQCELRVDRTDQYFKYGRKLIYKHMAQEEP